MSGSEPTLWGVFVSILVAVISALVSVYATLAARDARIRVHESQKHHEEELQKRDQKHEYDIARLQKRYDEEIENIKSRLESERYKEKARTDYEYEARVRLYREYEPLLFQFYEVCEGAYKRIEDLAGIANAEKLNFDGTNPTADSPKYATDFYQDIFDSTLYKLLIPLASFKLLQQRLTHLDLELDKRVQIRYIWAKILYYAMAADMAICKIEPILDYHPDHRIYGDKRETNLPSPHRKQGIFAGTLDNICDRMLVGERSDEKNLMSFGEFQSWLHSSKKNVADEKFFNNFVSLFSNFHPKTHPVLWRILIVQAHIYRALLSSKDVREDLNIMLPLSMMPPESREKFDWRGRKDGPSKEVLEDPFDVAQSYLKQQLVQFENERS